MCIRDRFYPITVTPNTTIAAVILSVSGETKQVLHLARQLKEKHAGLIAITCSDPVSYTHLDVYKRQQIGCGNGRSALDEGTFNGILDHSFQICAIVALSLIHI